MADSSTPQPREALGLPGGRIKQVDQISGYSETPITASKNIGAKETVGTLLPPSNFPAFQKMASPACRVGKDVK